MANWIKLVLIFFKMPAGLGPFETSLRGGDSPSVDRKVLHKGCCGTLHGHGVKKERASRELPAVRRTCSNDINNSSSDESMANTPDLLMMHDNRKRLVNGRSQSSDCASPRCGTPTGRRSNSAVAQRLYSSPTKSTTAKVRAERTASDGRAMSLEVQRLHRSFVTATGYTSMSSLPRKFKLNRVGGTQSADPEHEHDSGHFSSDTEGPSSRHHFGFVDGLAASEKRKQSIILGVSDDELSMEELRQKQRRERRDYLQQRHNSPRGMTTRKESPSPGPKKRMEDRGRRSSDDYSEGDSSSSPPATPSPLITRSISSHPRSGRGEANVARRTASSGSKKVKGGGGYAFGSSVSRFSSDKKNGSPAKKKPLPAPLNKSSSDGVQNAYPPGQPSYQAQQLTQQHQQQLSRTSSDPRVSSQRSADHRKRENKDVVAKAWLQFKADVENALQKKPNHGFYKNLSDMMHTKMEMLTDEVGGEENRYCGVEDEYSKWILQFLPPLSCLSIKSAIACKWRLERGLSKGGKKASQNWDPVWV